MDSAQSPSWKAPSILLLSILLLVLYHYFGKPAFLHGSEWLRREWLGQKGLAPWGWWAGSSLLLRVLIPLVFVLFVLRESPRDFGYTLGKTFAHWKIYLLSLVVMLPVVYWASTMPAFQKLYPFWKGALAGGTAFWIYEFFYLLQFVGVEAFFRGFLCLGLYPRFSWNAVFIMTMPYVMIHFGKPLPESLGAIGAGLFLGWMAIKTRSFWPGVLLHFGVALTMDLLMLARAG